MDTTMVRVNGVCNADCDFCELTGTSGLDEAAVERLRASLQNDRTAGATRLRISGGEPLMEPGLLKVLEVATGLGFETIQLETNGIPASVPGVAERLVEAGVTDALWSMHGSSAALGDVVYGRAGAHEASLEGAQAMLAAGIRVIARTPLADGMLEDLPRIPQAMKDAGLEIGGWWLRPLSRSPRSGFDPSLLPSLERLSAAIREAGFAAREVGLPVEIDDELGLPLCMFVGDNQSLRGLQRHPNRSRTQSHQKSAPCTSCAASGDCPGQPNSYVAQHGLYEVTPFERIPQALVARSSRPETYVIYDRTEESGDELIGPQVTIRVVMPCNQDCTFCFVDRTSPGLSDDGIRAAIQEAADRGAHRISFSGGEPTLHRKLASFVKMAAELGVHEREVQTNALRLTNASLADELVSSGLTQAVVSLHAVDPERYLTITGAGTPTEVISGVRNLLNRGIRVELNLVQNQDNVDHLSDVVETVAQEIPEVRILFSVAYIVEGLPRDWDHVAVRYTDAVPHLVDAMSLARERGVRHRLTGRCGTPPCAWRDHLDTFFGFELLETGSEEPDRGHAYVDACEGCVARKHCYGINVAYLERFGPEEFRALSAEDWESARQGGAA